MMMHLILQQADFCCQIEDSAGQSLLCEKSIQYCEESGLDSGPQTYTPACRYVLKLPSTWVCVCINNISRDWGCMGLYRMTHQCMYPDMLSDDTSSGHIITPLPVLSGTICHRWRCFAPSWMVSVWFGAALAMAEQTRDASCCLMLLLQLWQ